MSKLTKNISNTMSLREPLERSLNLLDTLTEQAGLLKNPSIEKIKEESPLFEEFQRSFPNICYSIATGVGKTRLMGAFVTYLYRQYGIKNFLIISPNITIYDKLKEDFGNPGSAKYVFKGLPDVSNNVNIISGEDYETKGIQESSNSIQINMFNIGKINSDVKEEKKSGRKLIPRIKRFRETLGDSYYNYLMNTRDLVVIMDEAHHYRADRGMETLNEINPILGIELTATPYDKNGKFKNIVFEYGLGDALRDKKYIKEPAVVTRKNTIFSGMGKDEVEKMKLKDAIQIHWDTKVAIENYVADNNAKPVKPIILVACSDTEHASRIYNYVTSNDFYGGEFASKTLQIDSSTKTDEKIKQLLSLENPDNKVEIVIHVDMLKEGWDVANLYTIVPLRAANAVTLIEQTIGRGLRLPFGGKRTGDEKVDMLSIMMHDRFQEIVEEAKKEDSILYHIGKVELSNNDTGKKKVSIEAKTKDEVEIEKEEHAIEKITDPKTKEIIKKKHIAKKIAHAAIKQVIDNKEIETPENLNDKKVIEKVEENIKQIAKEYNPNASKTEIEQVINEAKTQYNVVVESIKKNNIYIPNIIVKIEENKSFIEDFSLDTSKLTERVLQQEFELIKETLTGHKRYMVKVAPQQIEMPFTIILEELKKKPEIDYDNNAETLYNLSVEATNAIMDSLDNKDTLGETILQYREIIAGILYEQIKEHIKIEVVSSSTPTAKAFSTILPWHFSKIEDDKILDYKQTISPKLLSSKVFTGFKKSCHDKYKFDSTPEKLFSEILEDDKEVLKWLRPAKKQFNIWYNNNADRYVPDFVAETKTSIYLIEIKAENEVNDDIVQAKAHAAKNYCHTATTLNLPKKQKPWTYVLIPHDKVKNNMSFKRLVNDYIMD